MKELSNTLSKTHSFFTEKRFVFEGVEYSESEPSKPAASLTGHREIPVGERGREAVGRAQKYCDQYQDELDAHRCKMEGNRIKPAEEEIQELWNGDREFPGRNELATNLYYKIAEAGIREVTEADMEEFRKQEAKHQNNKEETEEGEGYVTISGDEEIKRAITKNRIADAIEAINGFMNKKPDFRDKVLIQLYIYLVKYPKNRDNASAQKVMDDIKKKMSSDRRLIVFLPNLKTTKGTAIATRPKIGK